MSFAPWLSIALLAASVGSQGGVELPASAVPSRSDAPALPALRLEHFALVRARSERAAGEPLEGADPAADRAAPGAWLGLVEWRRRSLADGLQLECETTFFEWEGVAPAAHVLHVECLTELGPKLVWRELAEGPGRCLRAEWSRDGAGLVTRDWGAHDSLQDVLPTTRGAVMPLFLLELARTGRVTAGEFSRFDPLVAALEPIEMCTRYDVTAGAEALRIVEEWRADGTLAGRYVFRGTELVAFQWHEGDVWARRISAEAFALRAGPAATVDLAR